MSIFESFRLWRRKRIIEKYLSANQIVVQTRPQRLWIPHWIRGDYTLRNSELIFAAVSRISNTFSAMPVQLYHGSKPVRNELNDLVSSVQAFS